MTVWVGPLLATSNSLHRNFPDAIEFPSFSFHVAPGEEFFTFNVTVSTEPILVPEPGTFALLVLGLGLIGLGLRRRRKS